MNGEIEKKMETIGKRSAQAALGKIKNQEKTR